MYEKYLNNLKYANDIDLITEEELMEMLKEMDAAIQNISVSVIYVETKTIINTDEDIANRKTRKKRTSR